MTPKRSAARGAPPLTTKDRPKPSMFRGPGTDRFSLQPNRPVIPDRRCCTHVPPGGTGHGPCSRYAVRTRSAHRPPGVRVGPARSSAGVAGGPSPAGSEGAPAPPLAVRSSDGHRAAPTLGAARRPFRTARPRRCSTRAARCPMVGLGLARVACVALHQLHGDVATELRLGGYGGVGHWGSRRGKGAARCHQF